MTMSPTFSTWLSLIGVILVLFGAITSMIFCYGQPFYFFMMFQYAPWWAWGTWLLGLLMFAAGKFGDPL